jgi:hypothetical protein
LSARVRFVSGLQKNYNAKENKNEESKCDFGSSVAG